MSQVQENAKRRIEAIKYTENRINAKLKAGVSPEKEAAMKTRLAEFAISKIALALELKSGTAVNIKDTKQMALIAALVDGNDVPSPSSGVVASIPAGSPNLEGQV